jgi:uncharacterized membrane protein
MPELLILRIVHVLSAIFWLGAGLMTSLFLVPALTAAGPAGGAVMGALRARGLMTWIPVAAGLTMLSGARLFWIAAAGAPGVFAASPVGRAFALSGIIAVVAFLLAMFVGRPAQLQAMQLQLSLATAAPEARPALEQRAATLRKRGGVVSLAALLLLVGSAMGMSVARYL